MDMEELPKPELDSPEIKDEAPPAQDVEEIGLEPPPAEEFSRKEPKTAKEKSEIASIMKLLGDHGLTFALGALERETGISKDEIKDLTIETDVRQVLGQYESKTDKDSYKEAFIALQRFVDQSLGIGLNMRMFPYISNIRFKNSVEYLCQDSTRAELSQLLYPVFAHTYIKLLVNNYENEARNFYNEFAKGFGEDSPYIEDIRRLATVTNKKQLAQNDVITTFKVRHFIIRMTRDSLLSLKRHINDRNIQVLIDILEDHLFIDQFDGLPRTREQIDAVSGGLLGEAKRDANKSKIQLGLLREPEVAEIEEDDLMEDEPKKKKKARAPTLRKTKNDANAPNPTRVPLLGLQEHLLTGGDKADWLSYYKDLEHRVKLTGDQKLSAVFYSVLNSDPDCLPASITISDDSTVLAAGFEDGCIRVNAIGADNLREMKSLPQLEMLDKDRLELDNILQVSEAATRKLLGHTGAVYGVSISPRKDFLASGGEDGTVRLWSLFVYQCVIVHRGHLWPVWDVSFSPYGHYFCSVGMDRSVRVWVTDKESPIRMMAGHYSDVTVCKFHPNGNYIATGGEDRCIRIWDLLDGKCVRQLTGHRSSISILSWSTACGKYLATADIGGHVLFWDLSKSTKSDEILIARFSIDEQKGTIKLPVQHQHITALTFSRCGSLLTAGTIKGEIISWDVARVLVDSENEEVSTTATGFAKNYRYHQPYRTKRSPICFLQYSRRNVLLAAGPFSR